MDTSTESKTTPAVDDPNELLKKIHLELKKINRSYSFFQIIGRGLLNGIATGIGATVGLALLLFLLTRLLSTFSYVPVINEILTITKLNNIIETKPAQTDNTTPTPTLK